MWERNNLISVVEVGCHCGGKSIFSLEEIMSYEKGAHYHTVMSNDMFLNENFPYVRHIRRRVGFDRKLERIHSNKMKFSRGNCLIFERLMSLSMFGSLINRSSIILHGVTHNL